MTNNPHASDVAARILIVDDEHSNRQLLGAMLMPEGYRLEAAASGAEALAMVARQPPDLVLLDVMMNDIDGYQVAAKIKGDPATRHIPIIMLTALDDQQSRVLGLKAGAEDFLSKPADRAELSLRVRNLLRLSANARPAEPDPIAGEVAGTEQGAPAEIGSLRRIFDGLLGDSVK